MATNLNWRGQWTNSNTYQGGDAVSYLGSSYVAIDINTYVIPSANPLSWNLLAAQGQTGPQGIRGLQGATGTGSTGPTGATGSVGPTGQGLTWRNTYSTSITYNAYDCVFYNGASYICIADGTLNLQPDTNPSEWDVLSAVGATGPTGATGTTGAAGATGAAGSTAAITTLTTSVLPVLSDLNLFDIDKITTGYYVDSGGGLTADDRWASSGMIFCPGATSMITNLPITFQYGVPQFALYDANGGFISAEPASYFGASVSGNSMLPDVAFTLPGTQVYVRFSYAITYLSVFGTSGYPADASTGMVYATISGTATLPSSFMEFGFDTSGDVNAKIVTAVSIGQELPMSYATLGSTTATFGQIGLSNSITSGGNERDILPGEIPQGSYLESITMQLASPSSQPILWGTFDGPESSVNAFTLLSTFTLDIANAILIAANTYKWTAPSGFPMMKAVLPHTHIGVENSAGILKQPISYGGSGSYVLSGDYPQAITSVNNAYLTAGRPTYNVEFFTRAQPPVVFPGDVPETRTLAVQAHKADGATTIFSATGPGNIEKIQYAIIGSGTGTHQWGPEAIITITVDGVAQSRSLGMFLLWNGYATTDGTAATKDLFISKYLGITTAQSGSTQFTAGYRRIYIKYTTSCTITVVPPSGFGGTIYSQVEYYPGVAPVGRYPATRNVFHMYCNEWLGSSISVSAGFTMLPTVTAAGELESIFLVTSAPTPQAEPGWLEQSPYIDVDGTHFAYGGTEDFFGNQFYGDQWQGRTDEWGIARYFTSGSPDDTLYWSGYRYFRDVPMTFAASIEAGWTNGTSGNAATRVGSLVVYYTES